MREFTGLLVNINNLMGKIMKKKILAFLALLPFVTFTSYIFSDDDEDVEAVDCRVMRLNRLGGTRKRKQRGSTPSCLSVC